MLGRSPEDTLREMVKLNEHPVNVRARQFLESTGEQPDPLQLHVVQLACRAIADNLISPDPAVTETLRAMVSWTPERLSNFFLFDGTNDILPMAWKFVLTPIELVRIFVEETDTRVFTHFPCYLSTD